VEELIIFIVLIIVGFFAGRAAESKHYRSIQARERELLSLPVVAMKHVPDEDREVSQVELVSGSVVISIDYFKRFLAGLRNFFGGRLTSYESLLDRARREAILRMKESAKGADVIVNFRLENVPIGKEVKGSVACVEMLAYGTAVTYAKTPSKPKLSPSSGERLEPEVKRPEPVVTKPVTRPQPSAEPLYKVVCTGEIAPGQDLERVKMKVAALYKVPVERCEGMFSGRAVTIKDKVDYQTAQKYKEAFERTGAICRIEEVS
jgi:uncharacterized protein YbjQ (UPF0145 family)